MALISSSSSSCLFLGLNFEAKVEFCDSYMISFELELFMLVPRMFKHAFKLLERCNMSWSGIFENIAVFCKFSRTGIDFWATEACASS